MMRIIFVAVVVSMAACTTVRINDDNTTSISHTGDAKEGQALADEACRKVGEQRAIVVATVNKDASLPAGSGKQITTFRCTSDPR